MLYLNCVIILICGENFDEHLREELLRVEDCWNAQRFDSLPHVVRILTSRNREGELEILKEQIDVVEEVVDEVVHTYHGGFNKAIQNYSQVLLYILLRSLNGDHPRKEFPRACALKMIHLPGLILMNSRMQQFDLLPFLVGCCISLLGVLGWWHDVQSKGD
ncbi:hypothetical protein F3Y22_tig00111213pilonHSYRG00571 [Hibiscus syriacus]|uniref:Exocyst complex component Sec8 n=1 Tax=Hibiscus syriacus TaxID=106335 RepID=A0A6A2YUS7_HIBSY|nr:hypothetical protein F3Y22_tig00111213pilonHSYRG00571 [Hibiscus syriacus]